MHGKSYIKLQQLLHYTVDRDFRLYNEMSEAMVKLW